MKIRTAAYMLAGRELAAYMLAGYELTGYALKDCGQKGCGLWGCDPRGTRGCGPVTELAREILHTWHNRKISKVTV